jgi:hypothetical protein
MWAFAMEHEIISLIAVLSTLWAGERVITALINRNKPVVQCPCHEEEEDENEEEE